MVVYIVNDMKVGFSVGDVVNVDGRYEARHDGVLDLGRDVDAWNLWSGAVEAFFEAISCAPLTLPGLEGGIWLRPSWRDGENRGGSLSRWQQATMIWVDCTGFDA